MAQRRTRTQSAAASANLKEVSESFTIEPGQLLDGRYRIVRRIATGGMGTVFEATHVKIGRTVALKILHRDLAGDPELVRRFVNEARAVGTFGHPHIVASTDFGELPGHVPYVVLEYLTGRTLGHELFVRGRLPVERAVRIAAQIASALSAAHARGVVHRDLTAENVFLTLASDESDHVKVLDFGISKFLTPLPSEPGELGSDPDPRPTTRRGLTMGTPEFMAPEQISDPSSVDARVDIYALGVVLYYMLAGQTPYGRLPAHLLLGRVLTAPVPVIERRDIPDVLRSLLVKALAKSPDDRFATMVEMEAALNGLGGSVAAQARALGQGPSRHRNLSRIGAAVALALAATLSIRALVRSPENPSSLARAWERPGGARRPEAPAPIPAVPVQPSSIEARPSKPPAAPSPPPAPKATETARPAAPATRTVPRRVAARKSTAAASPEPMARATATETPMATAAPMATAMPAAPAAPAPAPETRRRPTTSPSSPVGPRPGSVDPAAVQTVVRSRLPDIERCYARGKMDDPELKGRVTVRIRIAPSGAVTAATVESSSLAQSTVESCIVEAVGGWTFPPPSGGRPAVISYPFNLR